MVLSEHGDFPTDLYMLEGAVRSLGGGRRLELRSGGDIEAALTGEVALLVLCQTHFRTGAVRSMATLTAKAQAAGALVLWDLSHSAGVLEVDLNGCNADLVDLSLEIRVPGIKQQTSVALHRTEVSEYLPHYTRDPTLPF